MSLGYPLYINGHEVKGPFVLRHAPVRGFGEYFPHVSGLGNEAAAALVNEPMTADQVAALALVNPRVKDCNPCRVVSEQALTAHTRGSVVVGALVGALGGLALGYVFFRK